MRPPRARLVATATFARPVYAFCFPPEGDGAPRSAILLVSASVAECGRRLAARQSRRLRRRAPLQSRTVCPGSNCQLLAGTPSGPGGSPDAARVSHCVRDPRAPRPVPQLTTPRESAPSVDEVMGVYGRFGGRG